MFEVVELIDQAVWSFFQAHQTPLLNAIVNGLTELGHPLFWIIIAAILYWHGRESNSFWLSTTILVTSAVIGLIKVSVDRVRPENGSQGILSSLTEIENDSFPSGHAGTIGAVTGFLNLNGFKLLQFFSIFLLFFVSLSRLYLGAHFLSDVIVGVLIGLLIAWGLNEIRKWVKEKHVELSQRVELLTLLSVALLLEILGGEWRLFLYFAGFYVGMIIWEKIKPTKIASFNETKVVLGLMGMAFLMGGYYVTQQESWSGLLVLASGLWVTLLFPLSWNRWFSKSRQRA